MRLNSKFGYVLFLFLGSLFPALVSAQTPSVTICVDGTINYREFNTGGNEQSIGWLWTFESGDPAVSIEREPSVKYRSPGLFKATCISIFPSGGRDTNSAYVLVIPNTLQPIPAVRDTVFCGTNIMLILNAGNNQPYNRFRWTSTDVNLAPGDTLSTLTVTRAGTYKVNVSNICASVDATAIVKQGVKPSVDLGPDRFVCRNITVNLDAGSNPGYSYLWTPGGEQTSSILAQFAGTYKVRVTSQDGCFDEDEVVLTDSCPPVYFIPNAFTPNDAPPNDIFKPYLEGYRSMNMRIYNRWGEKMYETNDLDGGWDGNANGGPAIEGMYICMIELIGNDGFRRMDAQTFFLFR
jgi:gliding motility-associated-like protein